MKSNWWKWLVFAVSVASLACLVSAQVGPSGSAEKSVGAVTVPFLVDDGHGNSMAEISPNDLTILDDKKPAQRVIAVHTAKDMPLRLGVLIDTSGSQAHSALFEQGVKAASDFLIQELSSSGDRAFIVVFSAVPKGTGFMSKDELDKIRVKISPGGGTALYDAINLACTERMKTDSTQPARRILMLLSDGDDNLSHVNREAAVAAAQNSGTVIFAVSTRNYGDGEKGHKVLERLAAETGGLAFSALNAKDMLKVLASIKQKIEQMQSVTYVPGETGKSGQFHSVELKIASDKKWKVHAPRGYFPAAQ